MHVMTANSITSLSLEPPLVLFAIDLRNRMRQQLSATPAFAINLLRADQEALSQRFATPGPKDYRGLELVTGDSGAPILADCLGYLDCTVHSRHAGGDHEIVVGAIVGGGLSGGKPLLFYAGGYNGICPRPARRPHPLVHARGELRPVRRDLIPADPGRSRPARPARAAASQPARLRRGGRRSGAGGGPEQGAAAKHAR